MKILPALVLLLAAPQDHRRIVDLKLDGLSTNGCYVAVEKALRAAPPVDRVVFWVAKDTVRTHVVLKADAHLSLEQLETALAAAEKDLLDTARMTADYRLDEKDVVLPAGSRVAADGVDRALEKETSLADLRKELPGVRLNLPEKGHPTVAWMCPNGCSASDGAGVCPKCGNELAEVEAPKAPAGG